MTEIHLNQRQYLELEKLALGAFLPVTGFMNEEEFLSTVHSMRLPDGSPFPLPIYLDISKVVADQIKGQPEVSLLFQGEEVGHLKPESFYTCDKIALAPLLFGTADMAHPGVEHFIKTEDVFVGGPITLLQQATFEFSDYELTPKQTKDIFKNRNWSTIVGFQTRNVPHRAHEYLQRVALEGVDGLFVQPLVGRKRVGDFTPQAIMAGYNTMFDQFFPKQNVLLGVLSTFMRYAGPREAIFHAIIRRNYGCTHFIVGRDHAGVGDYYGKYEAHELTKRFNDELGITVLRLNGPFYCSKCDTIATEHTCPHHQNEPEYTTEISGTDMRAMLLEGTNPKPHLMRPEIIHGVQGAPLFITEEEE
ncbi:MAG: sulfate adenylyltransferase [Rhodospirillales bacterium]|nr:sulfate adenylyltransferase [Rhodospirillales bacterium]